MELNIYVGKAVFQKMFKLFDERGFVAEDYKDCKRLFIGAYTLWLDDCMEDDCILGDRGVIEHIEDIWG